ncbi:MAG TPA: RDD family protein [Paracoccaceae bacterium]|nr:RDD family protein [Paracoccaceae bacterium]
MHSLANPLPDPERHAAFYEGVPVRRAWAFAIDLIATALLTLAIIPFTAFIALFFLPLVWLVVGFFYRWVTLARGSATPGMRLMAIEFRAADGGRLDGLTALLHTLGFTMSWAFVLPQVASVALMVMHPRGQGLTDLVLGTVAIRQAARG